VPSTNNQITVYWKSKPQRLIEQAEYNQKADAITLAKKKALLIRKKEKKDL
jgi:hypothetical protein